MRTVVSAGVRFLLAMVPAVLSGLGLRLALESQ
jgi:hypothetical protein